jgi:hypothetical protein
MDFDQIDLLSLAQELCEIISHELYVTLLPIIDHPASEFLYNYNKSKIDSGNQQDIIAGIIRLDAIDKTKQPKYGAIKEYLDNLKTRGIQVENQDVGYELSNVTTDKFIVGAQEVETYFFSTERDRDELWTANQANNPSNMEWLQQFQWNLQTQEQQQVLPYYGKLGNNAVSIPRGFGAYQQILLDATTLNAYGVGNYYVATELELRAALVSYEKWKDFLLSYNDVYIEDTSEHRAFISALSQESDQINRIMNDFKERSGLNQLPDSPSKDIINQILNSLGARQYAVTVPRCVWHSDKPFVNENGYPASPCSPPFGYPLYYRRATSIGIVEAGAGTIVNAKTRLVKDTADLQQTFENINSPLLKLPKKTLFERMKSIRGEINKLVSQNKDNPNFKSTNERYKALIAQLSTTTQVLDNYDTMKANLEQAGESIAFVENLENGPLGKFLFNIEKTAKKHEENAKKVYDFVKSVADECLGKKFLVRIPKSCNVGYSPTISTFTKVDPFNIQNGPFGFPPRPIGDQTGVTNFSANSNPNNLWNHYLQDYKSPTSFSSKKDIGDTYTFGALKGNYNPFSENWEWNYKPEPQGGFYGFNVFGVNISALEALELGIPWSKMPPAIQQGLCPVDMTNLLSDSNRVQCYVRYNHSEVLDFTGVNPNDMVQQVMTKGGQFIPDIVEELPNNNIDNKIRFEAVSQTIEEQAKKERQPPSMAFVKCSVEENLFMPPRLRNYSLPIFGREYKLTLAIPEPKVTFSEVYSEETKECVKVPSVYYPDVLPVFSIPTDGGVDGSVASWTDFERLYDKETDSWIVDTNIKHLDDEHVYALITVPGRIRSIIDTRWNDGQNQAYQALQLKHLMTQDTVHIPEFNKPNLPVPEQSLIPCGPVPEFQNEEDAIRAARQYGLKGAHIIRGSDELWLIKADDRVWGPGKAEDWNRLSLEEITSARRIAKKVIQGSVANDPNIRLSYSQPSPVYPDIVALPLMSMERCYGPWLSTSQLDPEENPRIRYADIGGKVEFIKDENLAPWNYAGYQLMNEAGYLQAQFSNSLLLFSERGGFVVPDAPTGIALGTALQQEGPLITSIGINVSDGGVKTTVKLDLYTSKWGKLAKQKEMAISQIARERQKARDEKNSAIRRGLGKRSTSTDLVNTVMNAGGKQILDMVNGITNQIESNRDLGRKVSEGVIAVGKDGGVAYQDPNDLARAMSTGDQNTFATELANTSIIPQGQFYQAVARTLGSTLPSFNIDSSKAHKNITNQEYNTPE